MCVCVMCVAHVCMPVYVYVCSVCLLCIRMHCIRFMRCVWIRVSVWEMWGLCIRMRLCTFV